MRSYFLAALPLLALAGCGSQASQMPSTSNAPTPALSGGAQNKAPEAANSLPPGSQTNAPLTPTVGDVNSTRVGPATPVRPSRPTTRGY